MSKLKKVIQTEKVIQTAIAEAAQDILARYDQTCLKADLMASPGQIKLQKEKVSQVRQVLAEAEQNRAQEEAILVSLIASETNGGGKPVYSNKEARDAELITRKRNSPAYKEAEVAAKEAEQNLNSAIYELERLQDEFKALRITARITCKELALIGLDDEEEDEINDCY
jgi:acetolactate synthase small subunit